MSLPLQDVNTFHLVPDVVDAPYESRSVTMRTDQWELLAHLLRAMRFEMAEHRPEWLDKQACQCMGRDIDAIQEVFRISGINAT